MTTAHTATPWALNRDEVPPLIYANHNDENGQKCIALFDGHAAFPDVQTCEANAEFIVRACNAHDDLVKALQVAIDDLTATYKAAEAGKPLEISVGQFGRLESMRAALAKAGAAPADIKKPVNRWQASLDRAKGGAA